VSVLKELELFGFRGSGQQGLVSVLKELELFGFRVSGQQGLVSVLKELELFGVTAWSAGLVMVWISSSLWSRESGLQSYSNARDASHTQPRTPRDGNVGEEWGNIGCAI